jgi:hypothetical protein
LWALQEYAASRGFFAHKCFSSQARPHADILAAGNVKLHELPPFKRTAMSSMLKLTWHAVQLGKGKLGRLVLLPVKALYLFFGMVSSLSLCSTFCQHRVMGQLWILLVQVARCQHLLVQTPMAIPALPLAAFVSWYWHCSLSMFSI